MLRFVNDILLFIIQVIFINESMETALHCECMAITNKLTKVIGGDINVESEPGMGSAFTLRFPNEPIDSNVRLG